MSFLDTYHLATGGQNSPNTFTLASNGILVGVTIEDLPDIEVPIVDPGGGAGYDGSGWDEVDKAKQKTKKIKRKKITVTAVIEGKEHKKTLIVEDKNITIDNVEVDIIENKKTGPELKVRILL